MTLQLERGVHSSGFAERPELRFSESCLTFLTPNRGVLTFPITSDSAPMVCTYGATRSIPFLVGRGGEVMGACMTGRVTDGTLELNVWVPESLVDELLPRDTYEEMVFEIESYSSVTQSGHSLTASVAHESLNLSTIEPFLWSAIISAIREEYEFSHIALRVHPLVLNSFVEMEGVSAVIDGDSARLEFDCSDKGELPGVRFDRVMRAEYADAQWARRGELTLKDVCGVSRSSTCFGADKGCTYDDYVFARANAMCSACAVQSQVRDKFKVK